MRIPQGLQRGLSGPKRNTRPSGMITAGQISQYIHFDERAPSGTTIVYLINGERVE